MKSISDNLLQYLHSQQTIDRLIEEKFIVLDQLIPESLLSAIYQAAESIKAQDGLRPANVGRGAQQKNRQQIRSDSIFWLDDDFFKQSNELSEWVLYKELLMQYFNENLFLGLRSWEGHLAHYESGQKYDRHIDQSEIKNPLLGERVVTWITYFNKTWTPSHGGELCLHLDQDKLVQPLWGRNVIFFSQEVPHSVLASQEPRWSLTCWLRRI